MTTAKPKRWRRYLVIFWIGIMVGAGIFLLYYGREIEKLMLTKQNLELKNDRLEEEIENLKQSQKVAKKKQDVTIEGIQVVVLDPKPDAFTMAEVSRLLEKDLVALKGKKVDQVGELLHPILHEMIYRREYIVEGKTAEVRLKTAVISKVVQLFVTIQVKIDM